MVQVLSNTVKQKRKEKAGKWSVPIAKVKPLVEDEVLKVVKSGKRKSEYCSQPALSAHVCDCYREVLEADGG